MYIDFHAHFLHGVDDGAHNLDMAVSMLAESRSQGTEYIIATPHYQREMSDVSAQCMLRDKAVCEIKEYASCNLVEIPEIISGFEVDFHHGLKDEPDLKKLCISGTDLLLLEMPYVPWKQNDIEGIYDLLLKGIRPVIAHIDRYYRHFGESIFGIFELDAIFQLNCKVMDSISGRNFVKKLIKSDIKCVIGTDMHNITTRSCNISKAYNIAYKKLASYADDLFYGNAAGILF